MPSDKARAGAAFRTDAASSGLVGGGDVQRFGDFILQDQKLNALPEGRVGQGRRITLQIGPRHDGGGIVTRGVHDRHAHPRTYARKGGHKTILHPRPAQGPAQERAKVILTHGAEHAADSSGAGHRDRLIATFAAEFGIPARPDRGLILARQMVGLDHDVIVQAANGQNSGLGHVAPRLNVCPAQGWRARHRE
jgi:hypothetical protein